MWKEQWALHAKPLVIDGIGEIPMVPGPGFGDLSHPTTRLVLQMMTPYILGKRVLDLGCGSGVLSLAAHALGASKVTAIDIDPEAVEHTKENARQNHFDRIFFGPPEDADILLMNMIRSEQIEAWKSVSHCQFSTIFTSGIRQEDRENALKLADSWGWILKKMEEEDDWLGFMFIC